MRAVGPLGNLKERAGSNDSTATTGLGHTRWATHGGVTEANAHPLAGCVASKVSIVLNGIVENYRELREGLAARGHAFTSETDAETVTHLIEKHYEGDLVEAVRLTFAELEGHFAFVTIHHDHPGLLVGARMHGVPLVVGIGANEMFLASNAAAFLRETRSVQFPADGEIVAITPRRCHVPARRRNACRARADGARLGRRGRREGRLRDLHAQGDLRAARGRCRDDRRPRAARHSRPRGTQHVGQGRKGATQNRPARLRHGVPRMRRRPLRDRGVGTRPRRVRHRERVDLPQPCHQRARRRHRDHAVGRDPRHDHGAPARARRGRTHGRDHEHDGLAGDARGRLGPVHAEPVSRWAWPRRRRSPPRSRCSTSWR